MRCKERGQCIEPKAFSVVMIASAICSITALGITTTASADTDTSVDIDSAITKFAREIAKANMFPTSGNNDDSRSRQTSNSQEMNYTSTAFDNNYTVQ